VKRNCEVIVASSGGALRLLKDEFPSLTFLTIAGYDPVYPRSSAFLWKMFFQLPRFLRTIGKEHLEIENIVGEHSIDLIISDNRYGCYSEKVTSVFITHQLTIQTPFFSGWINFLNHRQIKKFDVCWVPDMPGNLSLARHLSVSIKVHAVYVGFLSRFKPIDMPAVYDLLAIISGPEPQRTIFERKIRGAFEGSGKRTLIIKGLPDSGIERVKENTTEVNHLSSEDMNEVMAKSAIVISRPGYSTIMDLAAMGKKAIFIPTPGQTEQEYLGRTLMAKGIAVSVVQNEFDLADALKKSDRFSGFTIFPQENLVENALNSLLS
jgi:hypothetical protein